MESGQFVVRIQMRDGGQTERERERREERKERKKRGRENAPRDYVLSMDDGEVNSTLGGGGPLVIPLIDEFVRKEEKDEEMEEEVEGEKGEEREEKGEKVEESGEKEGDGKGEEGEGEGNDGKMQQFGLCVRPKKAAKEEDKGDGARAVARWKGKSDKPMLLKNRPEELNCIADEREKFKADVGLRPEDPSLDDYSNVPVEMFGEAMLRGMGWAPGKPVGLSNAAVVVPSELRKRDHRMGLGAQLLPPSSKKKEEKKGEAKVGF